MVALLWKLAEISEKKSTVVWLNYDIHTYSITLACTLSSQFPKCSMDMGQNLLKKKCNVARSLKTLGTLILEIFLILLKIFSKG